MQTIIKTSYWGLVFNMLGSLFFITLYLWLILATDHSNNFQLIVKILAFPLILLLVYSIIVSTNQLIKKAPALIIDEEGFTNNFAGFDSYHLHWHEIDSLILTTYWFRKYIIIKSEAGDAMVKKLPVKSRILFYVNKWYYHTYIVVPLDEIDFHEVGKAKVLFAMIKRNWEASRGNR